MDICDLPTGTNATFNSTFMSQIESRNATVAVKAKVGPIWINFPLHATDACKFWGVSCPLETGGKYGISVGVPVIQGYPKFKTVVKVQLMDERGDFIVCQSFPAQIVDSNEI
ncbi:NPC intracellular cholesterol transporter 2 -like protein a [Halotydeus destructor]|nr:NPC intracellular cholesterol transporter 2 -like protein a [Halotydeus destructor]